MHTPTINAIPAPQDCINPTCGNDVAPARVALGYRHCLVCGEKNARLFKHCIVPMPKSNYIVVTDFSLLKGLNSSHKGVK
jgi:hypothetical protein